MNHLMEKTKGSIVDKIELKIRDFKQPKQPKCWQDKQVLRHIRICYEKAGVKNVSLRTALIIYLGLTEAASNIQSEIFQATHKTIAKLASTSHSTIRRYTDEFIKIRILKKEVIKNGKANQANRWSLLAYNPFIHASVQNSEHTPLRRVSKRVSGGSIQDKEQGSVQNSEQE